MEQKKKKKKKVIKCGIGKLLEGFHATVSVDNYSNIPKHSVVVNDGQAHIGSACLNSHSTEI